MFGIIVADYYLVKRQEVVPEDLYTMSSSGSLHYRNGWNPAALVALGCAGAVSIGLALLGAYGLILNVGDWGWLIGAALGGLLYLAADRLFSDRKVGKPMSLASAR
jgi:NCS1 family nucleobase:cation symporter-1